MFLAETNALRRVSAFNAIAYGATAPDGKATTNL